MSYLEEFQKQGRALRARPKVKVRFIDFDEMRKSRDTESRSKRRKDDTREIQKQLQEADEDF
jgi:hypothetical protein